MKTTVIRIGNSLGSRWPKDQLNKLGIKEGDEIEVTIRRAKPDNKKAIEALRAIANMNGVLANLDVEKWEAERRAEWEKRDQELRDILGR